MDLPTDLPTDLRTDYVTNYKNNTNKNEINSHELRIMGELKKEYLKKKIEILEEIILELQDEYKLLKKE